MSPAEFAGLVVYGMLVGVALAAPIGPVNIEIITRGLRHGFQSGWLVGLGALTADTIYAVIIVSGLTPIADRPGLRAPLYLAGAVMLGWVGYSSLRSAFNPAEVNDSGIPQVRKSYMTGFLIALLNPMGIVYWLSVGAALVAEAVDRSGTAGAPVLVGGVFLGLLVWVTALSMVGQVSQRFVTGPAIRWITGFSGVLIMGFAFYFLYQGVRALN